MDSIFDLPLTKKIFGHGWLVVDGAKISKSFGNYKDPRIYIKETSADALRYFLLREVTLGQDGNFSEEMFLEKCNSDLANDLGNLVSRVTAMIEKYNNGVIVKSHIDKVNVDLDLIDVVQDSVGKVELFMDDLRISDAVSSIWNNISNANKYIDLTMPCVLAKKNEKETLDQVLYNLAETIRIIGVLLQPFMIEVPGKIFDQLGVKDTLQVWDSAKTFGLLEDGTKVTKKENLFNRIDLNKENTKVEEVVKSEEIKEKSEKEYITIDELDKVELKVGQILSAERIENANKLYKLTVDLGSEKRTIVSGLVKYYTAEELINKQVVVVANLKPVKLRGVESQGMLLAAGDDDVVKLLVLDNNSGTLENGSNIH